MAEKICKVDLCEKERNGVNAFCLYHIRTFKGAGKLTCEICHQPQTEHDLGFYEHYEEAAQYKTTKHAVHQRK